MVKVTVVRPTPDDQESSQGMSVMAMNGNRLQKTDSTITADRIVRHLLPSANSSPPKPSSSSVQAAPVWICIVARHYFASWPISTAFCLNGAYFRFNHLQSTFTTKG
jgi:hypothetical protein